MYNADKVNVTMPFKANRGPVTQVAQNDRPVRIGVKMFDSYTMGQKIFGKDQNPITRGSTDAALGMYPIPANKN